MSLYENSQRKPPTPIREKDLKDYEALIDSISSPKLSFFKGLMKTLAGAVLALCTLGQKTSLVKSGLQEMSFFSRDQRALKTKLEELKPAAPGADQEMVQNPQKK